MAQRTLSDRKKKLVAGKDYRIAKDSEERESCKERSMSVLGTWSRPASFIVVIRIAAVTVTVTVVRWQG